MKTFNLAVSIALTLVGQQAASVDTSGLAIDISLSPNNYVAGDYSTIAWSATGATDCVASASPEYAPWSGHKRTDWAQSVAPEVSTIFTITCSDGTQSGSASTSLTVTGGSATPPPTSSTPTPLPTPPPSSQSIRLSLSPNSYAVGGYSTIAWSAPGATDCVASASPDYAPWSGHKRADWAQSVAPEVSTLFTLTCNDGSQSRSASTSLTVTGGSQPTTVPSATSTPIPTSIPAPTYTPLPTSIPSPAPMLSVSLSLNPTNYSAGGYSTIAWSAPGATDCLASASPDYAPWSGYKLTDWAQSVAPTVSTIFTLTCSNGSESRAASTSLTVIGDATSTPTPPGTSPTATPTPTPGLPVPTILPTPITLTPAPIDLADVADAPLLDFSHTANREWNYGGHNVAPDFSENYGNWDYTETTYEPWLYDRPTVWYRLYQRTDNSAYREYFLRDLSWYASHISDRGFFTPKGSEDNKYLYITPFVLYERDTGNTQYREVAARIWQASRDSFPNNYDANSAMWTERQVGLSLEAAVAYYELTADTSALARAAALVRQWTVAAGTRGAPMVSYTRHEGGGPGGTTPQDPVNSPWMSALYFQAARRYWQITGEPEVLRQVSSYFDWLTANGLYDGSLASPELAGLTVPRYLAGSLIGDAGYDYGNIQHCLDVAGLVSFAIDAKQRRGENTAIAEQRYTELRTCAAASFNYMTRSTDYLPKYRVNPPRMWSWWVRGGYESALR